MKSATQKQIKIAAHLGINIAPDSSNVTAGRILDYISIAVGEKPKKPASEKQREYGKALGLNLTKFSFRVASAMIQDELDELSKKALSRLRLVPGNKVWADKIGGAREYVVSSIGKDGRVYFKGGNGACAWPTQISKTKPHRKIVEKKRAAMVIIRHKSDIH